MDMKLNVIRSWAYLWVVSPVTRPWSCSQGGLICGESWYCTRDTQHFSAEDCKHIFKQKTTDMQFKVTSYHTKIIQGSSDCIIYLFKLINGIVLLLLHLKYQLGSNNHGVCASMGIVLLCKARKRPTIRDAIG